MGDLTPADMTIARRPDNAPAPIQGAQAMALQSREQAVVQGMIVSAKNFPRDEQKSFAKIMRACELPSLAESASYAYPKGGQTISGPSVHLARMLASSWGNIEAAWREVQREPGGSHCQAWCWDLETNARFPIEFFVPHIRTTKKGVQQLTDERDIYEINANMSARRLRACILAVIPKHITDAAEMKCEQTLNASGTMAEKIPKLLASFQKFGVTPEQIQMRIGKRVDAISPGELSQLRKIFVSLSDDMSKPSDWFQAEHEPEKLKAEIAAKDAIPETPATKVDADKAKNDALKALTIEASEARKRGGDPDKILNKKLQDVLLSGNVDEMNLSADLLAAWGAQ